MRLGELLLQISGILTDAALVVAGANGARVPAFRTYLVRIVVDFLSASPLAWWLRRWPRRSPLLELGHVVRQDHIAGLSAAVFRGVDRSQFPGLDPGADPVGTDPEHPGQLVRRVTTRGDFIVGNR